MTLRRREDVNERPEGAEQSVQQFVIDTARPDDFQRTRSRVAEVVMRLQSAFWPLSANDARLGLLNGPGADRVVNGQLGIALHQMDRGLPSPTRSVTLTSSGVVRGFRLPSLRAAFSRPIGDRYLPLVLRLLLSIALARLALVAAAQGCATAFRKVTEGFPRTAGRALPIRAFALRTELQVWRGAESQSSPSLVVAVLLATVRRGIVAGLRLSLAPTNVETGGTGPVSRLALFRHLVTPLGRPSPYTFILSHAGNYTYGCDTV